MIKQQRIKNLFKNEWKFSERKAGKRTTYNQRIRTHKDSTELPQSLIQPSKYTHAHKCTLTHTYHTQHRTHPQHKHMHIQTHNPMQSTSQTTLGSISHSLPHSLPFHGYSIRLVNHQLSPKILRQFPTWGTQVPTRSFQNTSWELSFPKWFSDPTTP